MNPSDQQDDVMQNIQNMIGNLLKNAIEKVQQTEMSSQLGTAAPDSASDSAGSLLQTQMDITEIKNIVNTMQKFLDNISTMIAQLESGNLEYGLDNDKFLDDYIDTADNIFEIAAFSMKDDLTGLSNKYGFDNRIILEWNRAAREKTPLSLIIIGVDAISESTIERSPNKDILVAIAQTLESTIKRSTDYIARWSDDEFAALLPITGADGATIVAERICTVIEGMDSPCIVENSAKLMAFVGVCVQTPEQNEQPTDFVNNAHNAVIKAREPGQNSIIIVCDEA